MKTASKGKARDRGLSAYRPLPGVPDELVTPDGTLRPLWQPLVNHLQGLTDEGLTRATGRADQYLRDSGVFYRQYGSGQSVERPWPLSHIPVLIDEADWAALTPALIQRADLLETVLADLYGENRLVADGHLPAALVAGNPEWLRPLVGVRPASGHFLHFVAFEIGRGPDGRWWVLADRTQAPSGAGYALENRVATSRAYTDVFAGLNVHRLAGFFRDFRDALLGLRGARDGRVAIMTPGPLNETYFEQAWIARYMGVSLVQGEDLMVSDGRLMVRTVSGLRPLDVLWRRLDGSYADPLELDPASRIGTPGMVAVLRQGGLTMVNSLGSGVLETRALMAFLPKLSVHLTGQKLAIPNIATWWCGGLPERAQVMAERSRLVLSPALGTGLPFDRQGESTVAASLTPDELAARLVLDGPDLVAQEAVTLSTTPALIDGKLEPRPMSLRVFLARTPNGWQVMQGGFARIGASADPTALAMQRGGSAADVWVVSPEEVPAVSMVTPADAPYRRSSPGALPARAADNLFWLGRYVERTEGMIRLLRARHIRLAEGGRAALPLQKQMDAVLKSYGVDGAVGLSSGLLNTLGAAVATAGQVRDRFSPDGWSALNDLDKTARRMAGRVAPGDDAARALSALLRKLAGFSGLVHENMYRFFGWRFLSIGRQLERASAMTGVLIAFADPKATPGALDLCIELGDSVLTYRRRFSLGSTRETVIDLLALDPMNPRSVRHLIDGLSEQVQALPGAATHGQLSELGRAMLRCQVDIATATPDTLTTEALQALHGQIAGISDLLTEAYLR
ncbi:circularly permuted type 2 ATP-grasp protein [Pseudotabrizicola sp.]|uniref:circularly permuted type 2 ATP-grasp protein n=1 Tax=Pseudotabrizicola sp. TaxID=2939647 RepID=UPI00271B20EB|nr:circularly permuted type 2 ATP-grasp protein [Pseudotabrizicola sp.]MDO8881384.1 circularly permuted type 2 ATP-grasp protein [Pseudotabrizicola sp.]MDP2081803.1 circularly permuted type 2 ATP-grasp protein [Pseudotabrizicola sp.]